MIAGIKPEGKDEYIGWLGLPVEELFRLTWAIEVDYFFAVEASLMIASKGGLDMNILNKMGIRSKTKYFNIFKGIISEQNKSLKQPGEEDSSEGMSDTMIRR